VLVSVVMLRWVLLLSLVLMTVAVPVLSDKLAPVQSQ